MDLAKTLVADWPERSSWESAEYHSFKQRLELRWGKAFDYLRMLLTISRELGEEATAKLNRSRAKRNRVRTELLIYLQARACQTATEVMVLMENGFADGAMARWRTLYEIGIVADLVMKHGDGLAIRYAEHQFVSAKLEMDNYLQSLSQTGNERIPARDIRAVKKAYDEVQSKYGDSFAKPYGWAAHHLGLNRVTFRNLETAVGRVALPPQYKFASYKVHAGVMGLISSLGVPNNLQGVMCGASNAGFELPGQHTLNELMRINLLLFGNSRQLDKTIQLRALAELKREGIKAFEKAARKLKREESQLSDKS